MWVVKKCTPTNVDCKTWFESKQANLLLVMVGHPELLGEDMDPSLTLNSRLSPHPNKVPEPDTNPARMAHGSGSLDKKPEPGP